MIARLLRQTKVLLLGSSPAYFGRFLPALTITALLGSYQLLRLGSYQLLLLGSYQLILIGSYQLSLLNEVHSSSHCQVHISSCWWCGDAVIRNCMCSQFLTCILQLHFISVTNLGHKDCWMIGYKMRVKVVGQRTNGN